LGYAIIEIAMTNRMLPCHLFFIFPLMAVKMIESRNLYFNYIQPDGVSMSPNPALFDVNISVESGEFIAVVGHNGSGF
jgi:ABC-type polysaccharide/polyol phosphate transport system ATPase subunit